MCRLILLFLGVVAALCTEASPSYTFYIPSLHGPRIKNDKHVESVLGQGWSTDNDASVGQCLVGGVEYVGKPSGSLSLDSVYSYEDVMKDLDFKDGGTIKFMSLEATAALNYVQMLKDTDFTQTFTYRASVHLKNRHFNLPSDQSPLSWIGQQYVHDPVSFRLFCGDRFVSQQELGGALYVAVKFHFHTHEEKKKFEVTLKAGMGSLINLSESLSLAADAVGKQGSVSITAFQIGGDPTRLGSILGASSGDKEVPILNCGFDNLIPCHEALKAIVIYASSSDNGNFPSQFQKDDSESLVGPAVLKNILQNYETVVPLKMGPTLITSQIADARLKVSQLYEESLDKTHEIQDLLNSGIPFSKDYTITLNEMKNRTDHNNSTLLYLGRLCYDNLSSCENESRTVDEKLLPIDLSQFLNQRINVFTIDGLESKGSLVPYSNQHYIYVGPKPYLGRIVLTTLVLNSSRIELKSNNVNPKTPRLHIIGTSQDGVNYYTEYKYHIHNDPYVTYVTGSFLMRPDFSWIRALLRR